MLRASGKENLSADKKDMSLVEELFGVRVDSLANALFSLPVAAEATL